jgi:hypothetical protein
MLKLAIILGIPVAMLATVASLGVVVVDVREGGPDGHRIMVPFPLVFAQAAREVVEALAAAPDGELVRVEERDQQVVVAKEGGTLKVRVTGRRENLTVNVPLHLALQALPGADGRIPTAALAGALSSVRFTDLVEVKDGGDQVRVWVW